MSFLLDSDICSAHLKDSPALTTKLIQHSGRIYVSTVTVGELYTWVKRSAASAQRLRSLADFLNDTVVLDLTRPVAEKFGEIRAALLDAGRPAPDMDLLIAATALVHGLTLVTHNQQDFTHVPNLLLDDWLST